MTGGWPRIALRALAPVMVILGANYLVWRFRESIDWSSWLGVAVFIAELVSFVDAVFFALTVCRQVRRTPHLPAAGTVDVFITTYDEPIDLVLETARAARRIEYPHQTWVLDDGARPELQQAAQGAGVGYITRDDSWHGKPRHAKAGNVINALAYTEGEFVLILDADQVPDAAILDRTLGYFADDPDLAFVQTPQWFANVGRGDILGAQAELFYGPIMRGKDGWGAAYFCGSNAVLRREALAQYGISDYSAALRKRVTGGLRHAARRLRRRQNDSVLSREARGRLRSEVRVARRAIARGASVVDATGPLQHELAELGVSRRARNDAPLAVLLDAVRVDRPEEARPVLPLATSSVTEDMATAVELHARGWNSVFHDEVLARGLAPTDLTSLVQQRLRWAQGTIQVLFSGHPLTRRGLTFGQRIMYAATIWSYLAGALSLIYLLTPILFLGFGLPPLQANGSDFLWHFVPYFVSSLLFAAVATRGIPSWRGQQYATALFPVWISAWMTTLLVTVFRRTLRFRVTPKVARTARTGDLAAVLPQIVIGIALCAALAVGAVRVATATVGIEPAVFAFVWAIYDLLLLSIVIRAAVRPPALRPMKSSGPDWISTFNEHSTHAHVPGTSGGGHRRGGPATGPQYAPRPSRSRKP